MALILTKQRGGGDVVMSEAPTPCLARAVQDANEVLIDALPYLDKELDNASMRARVESLVEAEMGNFQPRDYLGTLQPVPPVSFPKESVLWKEFERLKEDPTSKLEGIDLSKYEPSAPEGKEAMSVEAWEEALRRAHTAMEHSNISAGNMELLGLYGANQWRAHNIGLEDTVEVQQRRLAMEKAKVTEINRKRQQMQLGTAAKLQKLEDRYITSVHKNLRLQGQCKALEAEIEALEAKQAAK